MSHSNPENTRIPKPSRSISRTRRANSTARFSSSPFAIASAFEWSVIAMYS